MGGFNKGLAPAGVRVLGGGAGFIDKTGRVVIEPRFDKVLPFSDGMAMVMVDGKVGYLDKTGKFVWKND